MSHGGCQEQEGMRVVLSEFLLGKMGELWNLVVLRVIQREHARYHRTTHLKIVKILYILYGIDLSQFFCIRYLCVCMCM